MHIREGKKKVYRSLQAIRVSCLQYFVHGLNESFCHNKFVYFSPFTLDIRESTVITASWGPTHIARHDTKEVDFEKKKEGKRLPQPYGMHSYLPPLPPDCPALTQPPQDQVTKEEENRNPTIEYPFILHSPPLNHLDCIPTHS